LPFLLANIGPRALQGDWIGDLWKSADWVNLEISTNGVDFVGGQPLNLLSTLFVPARLSMLAVLQQGWPPRTVWQRMVFFG
jgi:hypothetical protein